QAVLQRDAAEADRARRPDQRHDHDARRAPRVRHHLDVRALDDRPPQVMELDDRRGQQRDPAQHHRRESPRTAQGAEGMSSADAEEDLGAQLRESVREVLKQARSAREAQPVWAPEAADEYAIKQAGALGWTGLLVEERWGGAGAGVGEAIV